MPPLFHIVMHQPEIPNNTGNIGRTCIATGCALHLVRPLGFETTQRALRRAGLDYWPRLNVREHDDWPSFVQHLAVSPERHQEPSAPAPRLWLTSGKSGIPVWRAELRPGDAIVFGKETAGLPDDLLAQHPSRIITLPMLPGERGLNVATAVCAIIYEGIRQSVARGDLRLDDHGRLQPTP